MPARRAAVGGGRRRPRIPRAWRPRRALLWVERRPRPSGAGERAPSNDSVSGGGGASARVHNSKNSWEERNLAAMAGYVANQIRTDPSETCGNGLRVALGAYQRVGLRAVFEHVRATGRSPRDDASF